MRLGGQVSTSDGYGSSRRGQPYAREMRPSEFPSKVKMGFGIIFLIIVAMVLLLLLLLTDVVSSSVVLPAMGVFVLAGLVGTALWVPGFAREMKRRGR